jgi:hypothetical protein
VNHEVQIGNFGASTSFVLSPRKTPRQLDRVDFWEESIVYFPLIYHGEHRKRKNHGMSAKTCRRLNWHADRKVGA